MPEEIKPVPDTPQDVKIVKDDQELKILANDMPKVVQDAVDAADQASKEEADRLEKLKVLTDSKGNHFDPNIHAIDPKTDEPVRTPKFGKFKRKLKIPEGITPQGTTAAPTVDPIVTESKEWAMFTIMFYGMLIQEEAAPSDQEFQAFMQSYEGIFRKYGVIPMGVEAKLALAHIAFIGARLKKPKTQGVINSLKLFFVNLYLKAIGKNEKIVSTVK